MATELAQAYVQIIPSAKGIKNSLTKEIDGAGIGKSSGLSIGAGLKKMVVGAGVGAAVVKVFKESIGAGSELQQSFGGLETIYGEAADAAKAYAYEASQAGISANDYAEQAVSFGASLKQAFGGDTTKAVEAANTAILDMTDNAAKMGTPLESIQNAYQGFAKQNYTMLDNLKLGYGGTKTEMERLLADAEKLTGVKYDISNLGDVYDAIHVIQEDLGLTGVAAAEASTTFSGSFGAMKAATSNFLANMALGESIAPSLTALVNTTKTFLMGNLIPMIWNIVKSIPEILKTGWNLAANAITSVNWLDLGQKVISGLRDGVQKARDVIPNAIRNVGKSAVDFFKNIDWKSAGQKALSIISDFFKLRFYDIPGLFTDIGKAAVDVFKMVDWKAAGSTAITLAKAGINMLKEHIPSILKEVANRAVTFFKGVPWKAAGSAIITFIQNGISAIQNNLPNILKAIGNKAISLFKSVNWKAAGSAIITFIQNGVSAIQNNVPNILKAIGNKAISLFKGVNWKAAGSAIITLLQNGIRALVNNIPNAMKAIGNTAINWIKGVDWAGAGKAFITKICNGIRGLVNNIPSAIKAIGNTAISWIKGVDWAGAGKSFITGILNGIRALVNNIPSALKEICRSAINSIKNMDWSGVGRSIVSGIKSGVSSIGGSLASGVIAAARNALAGAKAALGINSPSKVFADVIGRGIMEGISLGVEQNASDTQKTITDELNNIVHKASGIASGAIGVELPNVAANATVSTYNGAETIMGTFVDAVLAGTREIADGVEKGIGNMRMISNNRETARFIADLGFAR